jgi:putative hydrolase of the HAD superfamily
VARRRTVKAGIRVISFDVDGTIVDGSFMDRFWNETIPELYSKKHGIEYSRAVQIVKKCYDDVGDRDIRWYLPDYWFRRFDLEIDFPEILKEFKKDVKVFEDALDVLEELSEEYTIIAVSNAVKEIMKFELEDVGHYFSEMISCPTDFKEIRKHPEIFLKICDKINVKPENIVHVGDHPFFDYEVPMRAGIKSFLIDRTGKNRENLMDLRELKMRLNS